MNILFIIQQLSKLQKTSELNYCDVSRFHHHIPLETLSSDEYYKLSSQSVFNAWYIQY